MNDQQNQQQNQQQKQQQKQLPENISFSLRIVSGILLLGFGLDLLTTTLMMLINPALEGNPFLAHIYTLTPGISSFVLVFALLSISAWVVIMVLAQESLKFTYQQDVSDSVERTASYTILIFVSVIGLVNVVVSVRNISIAIATTT